MQTSTPERGIIGRRALLKALAASGGAVAAATMLPGKWVKPVIEAGVLPVHAQASRAVITIANLDSGISQFVNSNSKTPFSQASFDFNDLAGGVNDSTQLLAWENLCGALANSGKTIAQWGGSVNGTTSGKVWFPYAPCNWQVSELCVQLQAGARTSNKICTTFTVPNSIKK